VSRVTWPRVGFSGGTQNEGNQCYGVIGGVNQDLNSSGQDVCKHLGQLTSAPSYEPEVGDAWMKIKINNCPDRHWKVIHTVEASDIEPGSRNSMLLDGYGGSKGFLFIGGAYYYQQRFSPTFIPYKSAKHIEGPSGSNNYAVKSSPFDAWDEHWDSGVHGNFHPLRWSFMLDQLDGEASVCTPVKIPPLKTKLKLSLFPKKSS
jgi:hypothetical protein